MPKSKLKTTFTATFNTKVGKTPITILVPIDLATVSKDTINEIIDFVTTDAKSQLTDLASNAKWTFKNSKDLRVAHKAVVKASLTSV